MNDKQDHFYKLRILKTWVARDPSIVFQCNPSGSRDESAWPKKTHLFIDLRQHSFGLRLQAEKPSDADANHAFIQILRKQLPGFTIRSIFHDAISGDHWLPLLGGTDQVQPWMIRLAGSKPPLASLLAPDHTVFVSFGQKGTFTKKHQGEAPPAFSKMTDILPQLMRELLGVAAQKLEGDAEKQSHADREHPAISQLQKDLAARLKRKLKTSKKTLEKVQTDIPSQEEVTRWEREANLLQSYAWMVKPEAFELRLEIALTGLDEELTIALDPDLSVGKNMERKFSAFQKARRGRELGQKHLETALHHLHSLETDLLALRNEQKTDAELQQLIRKYRLPELQTAPTAQNTESVSKPYKTYTSSTGHSILVGKTAIDNDELTKSARSNDFWFHAVGVTGSHVIVPITPDIRQALPTQLLREAAILALHFSRVREDLAGECYITRKAHIKKQRGMPAGLWRIDQSESLFFRYSEEDLQSLLQTVRV